jgi:hypothetical protein
MPGVRTALVADGKGPLELRSQGSIREDPLQVMEKLPAFHLETLSAHKGEQLGHGLAVRGDHDPPPLPHLAQQLAELRLGFISGIDGLHGSFFSARVESQKI